VACLRRPTGQLDPEAKIDSILQLAGPVLGRVTGIVTREELTGNPDLGNDLLIVSLFGRGGRYADGGEVI